MREGSTKVVKNVPLYAKMWHMRSYFDLSKYPDLKKFVIQVFQI